MSRAKRIMVQGTMSGAGRISAPDARTRAKTTFWALPPESLPTFCRTFGSLISSSLT